MDQKRTTKEKKIEKSFDEYWAEEDKMLKMSYEMSKKWREMRLNKSPAKELVDRIEGRIKDNG
tara:strand:+ start:1324 stop:1512 length:189 start_codon:yes stop_codon:yes gene_type:complete